MTSCREPALQDLKETQSLPSSQRGSEGQAGDEGAAGPGLWQTQVQDDLGAQLGLTPGCPWVQSTVFV